MTILEDFTHYLMAKGYSIQTTAGMIKTTHKFLTWITQQGIEITTITYNDITAYIKLHQQKGIKTSTTNKSLIHVKHYLNYLVATEILSHNPSLALKLKNTKQKTVYQILNPDELDTIYKSYPAELPSIAKGGQSELSKLARKRNKLMLSLFIYQGIAADDIKNITLSHVQLIEGKLTIPGTRRSNERHLKLEAHQLFGLSDYMNDTRKQLLMLTQTQSQALFINIGKGNHIQSTLGYLIKEVKARHPTIKSLEHIRACVITNWLKQYNKRQVQYMAGHRYISSTEAYEANNIEALQDDLQKYYPQF